MNYKDNVERMTHFQILLSKFWATHDHLRFGQIIDLFAREAKILGFEDTYYVDDSEAEQIFKTLEQKYPFQTIDLRDYSESK